MNIFILDEDPLLAVKYHCDEHVKKMVVESAQMLSTAHRFFAGEKTKVVNRNGRTVSQYILPEYGETPGMKMTQTKSPFYWVANVNHPCNKWVRECSANYEYLYRFYVALAHEYILRYRTPNKAGNGDIMYALENLPRGIRIDSKRTSFIQAMPVQYQRENAVEAYREFYVEDKSRFATWTKGVRAPDWYRERRMTNVKEFVEEVIFDDVSATFTQSDHSSGHVNQVVQHYVKDPIIERIDDPVWTPIWEELGGEA